MKPASEVWKNISNIFLDFKNTWSFVFEFFVVLIIVYFVLRTLKENNAGKLIFVYVFLILCMGVVTLFFGAERFGAGAFFLFLMLLSAFFMLLFSIEIKRGVWKGAHPQAGAKDVNTKSKAGAAVVRADECITGIVKAVQSLSKNNIGALIVLSNGNLPKEIVESGVGLGAKISNQLIEGIFIPKAPLHDGAMIIYGDKIQAAGCFLPLTQKDFPKDYGTRHRAGIGVTEVADVSTIIVSEETGIVSIVRRGEITRYVDSESLKKFLREYYWKEFNAEGKKA